jgi:hypothetical protein
MQTMSDKFKYNMPNTPLHILITGGTGFIGTQLQKYLHNHHVTVLSRTPRPQSRFISSLHEIQDDNPVNIVINLTGAPISKRWSASYKKTLFKSRVQSTEHLLSWMEKQKSPPSLFISASAIGYYGSRKDDTLLTEDSPPIDDFTHQLCHAWEEAALQAQQLNIRTCILRLGVVLGENGGILAQLKTPFSLGLGGHIGNGRQILSWIAMYDLMRLFLFLINTPQLSGTFNATAPNPVSNKVFTSQFAQSLRRPAFVPMSAPVVRLLFGEMGEHLLLRGQNVIPKKILDSGFVFQYPHIKDALKP